MATTSNMTPGQAVYRPFRSQEPGIVLSNVPADDYQPHDPRYYRKVRIFWVTGETTDEILLSRGLNDFGALIEEHRRKLATHEAALAKLRAMALAR